MIFRPSAVIDKQIDPQSFIEKARTKLEQIRDEEKIEIFYIFEKQLLRYWQNLKTIKRSTTNELAFDLGYGSEKLNIKLGQGNKNVLAFIKECKCESVSQVSYEAFAANILVGLRSEGVDHLVPDFTLRTAYYHLQREDLVTPYPIVANKTRSGGTGDLAVTINKQLAEAYLYAYSDRFFHTNEGLKQILSKAKQLFPRIKAQFPRAEFLDIELTKELKEELSGPASVGVDLPKVFTIAINASHSKHKKKTHSLLKNPKTSPLRIKVDEDELTASIVAVKAEVKKFLTLEKMTELIRSHGIKFGYQNHVTEILELSAKNQSLIGAVVAHGNSPGTGLDPYLHITYLDNRVNDLPADNEDVDLRNMQINNILVPGDIIAEMRYKDGVPGKNVFGEVMHARVEGETKKLRVGKNVELDSKGRAVSKIHGMPLIVEGKVDCNPVFIHNGDINLSSGNLEFEGSAEVRGNIEGGAVVSVAENLIVKGTIGSSKIRCKGNLHVKGGIVCADGGRIEVDGKLVADFIENSQILVQGDLIVNQSIINSTVIVGGKLQIKANRSGVIGGGNISVREKLITGNLGFNDGRKTIVRMGVDYIFERKVRIQTERLSKVVNRFEIDNKNLEELKKGSGRLVDKTKLAQRNALQKRLDRMGKIKRKLERKINHYQEELSWNKACIAIVNAELSQNSEVTIGGKSIPIKESLRSVMLTYYKLRNGRVNPLEYMPEYEAKLREKSIDEAS